MTWLMRAVLALACCLGLWTAQAADGLVDIPPLQARVTDLTGTLGEDEKAALERTLADLEKSKGSQVVILMLPSTAPEPIEQYGIRLAGEWKIGRRGVHDGVIVLVARDDRRMRIEVGYGLEGAIPDAIAKRIVSDIMAPKFRHNDFNGGLQDGIAAIAAAIAREPLPAPAATAAAEPTTATFARDPNDWMFGLFALVVLAGIAHRLMGLAGSGIAAAVGAGLAWFLFGSLLIALVAAVIVFFGSFARGGGRGMGGGLGGGFGGGGFGGGGFSGGGGGFGGGGASGRW